MIVLLLSINLVLTYLIGSIPFAYLYGKIFKKIDIREHGSGNVGATNVLRVLGTKAGIIVLLFDILKGFLPVLIISYYVSWASHILWLPVLTGVFAILGHSFTIFLSFKGGKGVATSAGVFLALSPYSFLGALLLFIVVVYLSKYVSLGSMVAAVFLVVTHLLSYNKITGNPYVLAFTLLLAFFIIIKHKSNIKRLISGTENKISFSKK